MNRFPGYGPPPVYGPVPPQVQRSMPSASPDAFHPARIALGLLNQSTNRYHEEREAIDKLDRALSDFDLGMSQLLGRVSQTDPAAAILSNGYQVISQRAQYVRKLHEALTREELHLQGDLKRLMSGQPPSGYAFSPQPPQPQQPQQPQPQQPPQQPPQPQQPQYQPAPLGIPPGVDLRDPAQAAAFLQRAQPMPMGAPGPGQIPTPYQAPPGVYVVPPAQYGAPPGGMQQAYRQEIPPQPAYQPMPAAPPQQPAARPASPAPTAAPAAAPASQPANGAQKAGAP